MKPIVPPAAAKSNRKVAEYPEDELGNLIRLLVESVQQYAIFVLDPQGRIVSWNRGAERLKGYSAEEVMGRHFSIFYPAEDIAAGKPARELAAAARDGEVEDEGWRIRKDGTRFWANVLITALRDADGELVGFAKVARDQTERRSAQASAIDYARRKAVEEAVRTMAEDRARELRNLARQLREQAQELEHRTAEAEAANRAKSAFLAAMSHELRTPLNAIGGYAELLEMGIPGPINDQQRQQLERIRDSQRHLLGLINDILNFSRVEAGQVDYVLAPVRLAELVEEVLLMVRPRAMSRTLVLRNECTGDWAALADRAKLEQIVLNLLSNAVKFTQPEGEVAVQCGGEGDRVTIEVRDTGPGIAPDKLESIFEPFVQVGRTLSSIREGTGLGLAVSRDLARAMGGDVTARSTVGEGSTFTIILPAAGTSRPTSGDGPGDGDRRLA